MLKFFRLPFATTGDKTAVPDAVDTNGNVSYSQGYGFDYQRQKTDPAAKNIERDKMNQIFFDMTTAIAELQSQGVPDFITTALNGGTAYSYAQYAVVKYSGDLYISLVAANTALPSDATKWALLPTPARIQAAFNSSAVAGGTANAITGAFTPAIAALPAAPGTLSVFVRAGSANTTTTPTFAADGTVAKTIVKGNNLPLVAGDIAGAGHWLELQYDATLDKWVLQNPAYGIAGVAAGNVQAQTYTAFAAAGTAPTFTLTPTPAVAAYAANQRFNVAFAANGTTGSNTLNVSGLGAKSIKQYDATGAKVSGIIVSGRNYDLQYDGTDFVILNPGGFNSLVRLNTANGYGSTNTAIRRYSNVVTNQGADITYTDSATAGASFTINTSGIYAISMSEQASSTACWAAIALNPATLTLTAASLPSNEVLAISTSQAGSGYPCSVAWTGYLPAGAVIRPFTFGTSAGGQGNANTITIGRAG
jgi:hypothetical protein